MIRTVIQAGFGNQLFQYATGYALAKQYNQKLELDISFYTESSNYSRDSSRGLNLLDLNLKDDFNVVADKKYKKYLIKQRIPFIKYEKVYGEIVPIVYEDVRNCRQDQRHVFKRIVQKGAVIYGFWQNTCYFDEVLEDIRVQFVPVYEIEDSVCRYVKDIQSEQSVGVHIRRGDFVALGWNKEKEYYDRGLAYFRNQIPNCRFYIFSDDVSWVKENYGKYSDIYVVDLNTKHKDVDEFFLLSKCKHQLISESTFGWWAAYLNSYSNKQVVIPTDAEGMIFDQGWIKI